MITHVLCVLLKIQQYWYIVCGVTRKDSNTTDKLA